MAILEGVPELTAALRSLPAEVQDKVLRKTALRGASIVRDQVKALAPVARKPVRRYNGQLSVPGTIKRAVLLKYAPEKSGPDASSYIVSIRRGKSAQKSGRDAFYFLWVEKGHRVIGRSGRVIGQAPPHPFFVPAYRASAARARSAMKQAMTEQMTVVINQQTFARVSARAASSGN